MSSKAEKDRGKQIEEKCQALLTEMLRDEDNKYCVDCDAKGPRWASWNLGIFLCIRCAGIHRNLGVHISKVKSVNLDTWTPEQVVSLQQMGNSRARAVYEANIPDNFRRPQTDTALEAFVRAKYEHKKYIAKEWVPTPVPNVKQNWDKELDEEAERQKKRKKEPKAPHTRKVDVATPQMIPKPKASTSPRPPRSSPVVSTEAAKTAQSATLDLFFDTPSVGNPSNSSASSNGEDIFSSFLSAPPAPVDVVVKPAENTEITDSSSGRTAEEESFFNQPAPSNQEKRQLTKDSILALYGSAPGPPQQQPTVNTMFGIPGGVYTQPQGGFPPQPAPGMGYVMPNMGIGAPVKNGLFNPVVQQSANVPMGSNPFFNIGANPLANPVQSFPHMTQQMPQQMGRMNLGGPMVVGAQPQGIMGMHQNPPINMQMNANNATTMNAFAPQNSGAHTLATNLWQ